MHEHPPAPAEGLQFAQEQPEAGQEGAQEQEQGQGAQPQLPEEGLTQHLLCKAYFDERAAQCVLPSMYFCSMAGRQQAQPAGSAGCAQVA